MDPDYTSIGCTLRAVYYCGPGSFIILLNPFFRTFWQTSSVWLAALLHSIEKSVWFHFSFTVSFIYFLCDLCGCVIIYDKKIHRKSSNMSSVCCGTKKQKLNNSYSNSIERPINGYQDSVAIPDMCYFCFDVLYCQLHSMDPPQTPNFTNDA